MPLLLALLLTVLCSLWSPAFAEAGKNYVLVIEGKEYEIGLDGSVTARTRSGADVEITLKQKEFSAFVAGAVSFEHRSDLSVAATDIDKDVHQYLVATGRGTMLLLQHYDTINPSTLSELMLHQLSKDDVAGGAKLEKSATSRKLTDGTDMKGLLATLKSPGDDVTLEIVATDIGHGGVIAITRIDHETAPGEDKIIDRFWSSLKIK